MKVTIIFYNLGGYHLARLASAKTAFDAVGIKLDAIEITGNTSEHPWGEQSRPDYVKTLSKYRGGDAPSVGDKNKFTNALAESNPDIVAIPGWGYDFSRIAIKWSVRRKKKLILMSESKKDDVPRNFLKECVKKYFWVNKFDAAIVGGIKHVDYLVELGMEPVQIFTGYDVVDNRFFTSGVEKARKSWASGGCLDIFPTNRVLLSANRFIPRKNLLRLIECFAAALSSGKMKEDWDLVLLGGGTDEQNNLVRATIKQCKVEDRVHCPGFVTYDEINQWYAAASVFVHPALTEQWGLVANEAMAAGLPLLLSNRCGCYPELLDEGVNGFGFNPESSTDITEKIIRIANSNLDDFGQASVEKIEREFPVSSFGFGMLNAIHSIK